jgi:hypothetical protein
MARQRDARPYCGHSVRVGPRSSLTASHVLPSFFAAAHIVYRGAVDRSQFALVRAKHARLASLPLSCLRLANGAGFHLCSVTQRGGRMKQYSLCGTRRGSASAESHTSLVSVPRQFRSRSLT